MIKHKILPSSIDGHALHQNEMGKYGMERRQKKMQNHPNRGKSQSAFTKRKITRRNKKEVQK